jgi:hypothetical protein
MGTSARYINVQIVALLALVCAAASCAVAQAADPAASDFKVTLLGTSTPNPLPDRFGPSTLVEAGGERLLFDCGRGATIRLWQLKIPLGTVKLFITHLNGYTIRGSIVGTRLDLEEALNFAAEGKVKAIIETQPLESINDVFQRLKAGKVNG